MRKYGYLVVEGPHDIELAYRLVSSFLLKRIQYEKDLDVFFKPLIPSTFPHLGDLLKRMPVPLFLQSDTHCIAIHSAVGDSQLVNSIEESISLLDLTRLTGIGVLMDADNKGTPSTRYQSIKAKLREKNFNLTVNAGLIEKINTLNLGVFILPDNQNTGTLESLLLESAASVYPDLLTEAKNYINIIEPKIPQNESVDFYKPSGRNKAIVGAIANVLKPGKAVQVSIQDNLWFRGAALNIASIKAVQDFLKDLFEL